MDFKEAMLSLSLCLNTSLNANVFIVVFFFKVKTTYVSCSDKVNTMLASNNVSKHEITCKLRNSFEEKTHGSCQKQ